MSCCPYLFSRKAFHEKSSTIADGRQTPPMPDLLKVASVGFTRHFNTSQYENTTWLTGCPKLKKVFCWPCILSSVEERTWNTRGYGELGSLCGVLLNHDQSQNHLKSVIALRTFGSTRIDMQLDQQRIGVEMHNKKVTQNREVLQRLINIACVLGSQKLPFRGHN